jgi:hypothetical protein
MWEITEKYLMQVAIHIFVEIFCGVNLGFMLSFYTNSSSFIFKNISISAFVGFHGLNIPFYTFILHAFISQILSTQSRAIPADNITICRLFLSYFFLI